MCHQSVGLIQSIIEKGGIATVSITLLPDITTQVAPPRAVSADYPLGYPLGVPHDAALQTRIIMSALTLLSETSPMPVLRHFEG